jgi:hypothetical protein
MLKFIQTPLAQWSFVFSKHGFIKKPLVTGGFFYMPKGASRLVAQVCVIKRGEFPLPPQASSSIDIQ